MRGDSALFSRALLNPFSDAAAAEFIESSLINAINNQFTK